MTKPMHGRVVIVTGAASGIGKTAARLFAEQGARVAVVDRDEKEGNNTVGAIRHAGGEAIFIRTDVSRREEVEGMVAETVKTFGTLDYAFNNAGIEAGLFPLEAYTEETWDQAISINLKGVWLCMKYEIPEMLKNGRGAVVNTASAAGVIALPNHYAYVASKFGVVGITKVAALEFASRGVRVNCICPAIIDTPMTDRFATFGMGTKEQFAEMHPIKRLGKPEEVAGCAVWLCSDASSFVTGHSLMVDGGYTAQ